MRRILIALAVALTCVGVQIRTPIARADDPDQADVVRGMYDAGVPVEQIPEDLVANNPRANSPTLAWQVLQDLQGN